MISYNKIIKIELMNDTPVTTIKGAPIQKVKITFKDFWGLGNEGSYIAFPTTEYNHPNNNESYVNFYIYIDEAGNRLSEPLLIRLKYFLQSKRNSGELILPKEEENEK